VLRSADPSNALKQCEEVAKMIFGLKKSLEGKD